METAFMADRERKPKVDLDWLVQQRCQVQAKACKLFRLLEEHKDKFPHDQSLEDVAGLMVGTAFSLWRAIFLAPDRPTQTEDMIGTGIAFLDKFLRDNSIAYSDEKRHQDWSFGYYLNNARFRLRYVKEIQSTLDGYDWLKETHQANENVEAEWERHIKVFEAELDEFEKCLSD
jgi:hypothetical protein